MKVPATTSAKKKPAAPAGKGRPSSSVAIASKTPSRPASKGSATPVSNVKKPAAASVPKAAKKVVTKVAPKAAVKKVTQPVTKKAPVKPKAVPPKKTVTAAQKKPVPSKAQALPKPASTHKQPLPAKSAAPKKASAKAAVSAPAPIVIEPTPRPLGKRAAKKVMMEQMTQAAVVPTHAPNAAKATFSFSNERVMTSPSPTAIRKDPKRVNNWKSVPVENLTDQDVQSMPDSEYMNDVQLAYFRRKLSLLKDDMLANAGETTEHLREDTVVVPDPADRATIEEEHALELRTRDRERKLLKKIEQAITRIDSGDYGYCEETGEPIGVGRLMARPTASLSLEAQQRRELKQKMFGD